MAPFVIRVAFAGVSFRPSGSNTPMLTLALADCGGELESVTSTAPPNPLFTTVGVPLRVPVLASKERPGADETEKSAEK